MLNGHSINVKPFTVIKRSTLILAMYMYEVVISDKNFSSK